MKKTFRRGTAYKLLIKVAGYSCIGILGQLLLVGLCLAHEAGRHSADAQKAKSVHEVAIEAVYENASLADVFADIESKTDFVFTYDNKDAFLRDRYSKSAGKTTVADVLEDISLASKLIFQQINNNISVRKQAGKKKEAPAIMIETAINVSGTVTSQADESGLPGVNVVVKGSSTGTVTDVDGKYSINVPNEDDILVFSSIGYTTQEVPVNGRSVIDVALAEDVQSLEEVVVVGYGTQKKSDLTGAISSISSEEISQLSTQRVDQALQGRAAGVMVLNTDGAPGGNTTIRIRGMNSISGGNDALIVIDGLQGGDLNSLNPNDIESVEILKDASATAIYGSQGANGVVLITTKAGKKGKPMISYSYTIGVQTLREKLDLMNAADFARTINAYRLTQNGSGATPVPVFSEAEIQAYETNGGTDWQDVIFRPATLQNHELSIGGGTDKLKYFVSGGYLNQEGILENSDYKRFSLRANLNTDITKWAGFGLSWAGSKEAGNAPPFGNSTRVASFLGNAINVAPRWAPTASVYDANGNYSVHPPDYGGASDTWNPLASAVEPMTDNNTVRNTISSYLEFKPLEGLTLRITGGAIISNLNNRFYSNEKTYEGNQSKGLGIISEDMNIRYQNSNILTYDKTLSAHHLTLTAVAEQKYDKYNGSSVRASNFLIQKTGVYDLAGANIVTNWSGANERVINSYLGRINYIFADKYLVTASYRADGSSVFGKNSKWGYFPSGSIAWRASQETFIENLGLFSDLKLRASWGVTGNQAISPYQTLARISSGGNYPYYGGEATELGFYISAAANPSLKWESTTQIDFGIDIGLFEGRLTATADYYKKTTKDLLMARELPGYTGLESIIDNVGSVENKGIEIAVGGDPLVGNFKWNTGFNISANKNKVLDLGEIDRLAFRTTKGGYGVNNPLMYLVEGEPFGQMYGYGYEGTWKESEAEQAATYGQLPGDSKYTDVNHDGEINMDDIKVIGNAFPDFIFGWNNQMSYKNFELTFLIQGTKGNNIFNMGRIRLEQPGGTSSRLLDRWTPQHQDTDVPAFIDERTREQANLESTISFASSDNNRTSRWVEDGSYIRLKNITLAYNFPNSIMDKIQLSNLRIYISATNPITLTQYTGYDPEVSSYNDNDAQIGVDFSNYPQSKIFNLGLNVSF